MNGLSSNLKFLVTGGAGFIGSNVCIYLSKMNYSITVIDDLSTGFIKNLDSVMGSIKFYKSSIEEFNFELIPDVDLVIHLAAQTSVPLSVENFFNSSNTNLISSLKVMEFCRLRNIPLIYASSSAIYGNLEIGDDSNNLVDLISPYSADKYALEIYAEMLYKTFKISSIGLRFFNVYGERQDPNSIYSGVISIFVKRILNNKKITINGGSQTRDFIYINDVVKLIYKSAVILKNKKLCDTVNILSGKSINIEDLSELIMRIIGNSPKKIYKPLLKGDPEKSDGTIFKLKNLYNISNDEITDIENGLRQTIKFMRDSKN